jgi:gamma-glutamyltranspeptidase/glutathione hydrolase
MIATELALAVAYPYAGNIGGGLWYIEKQTEVDTRLSRKKHLCCFKRYVLDEQGNVPGKAQFTGYRCAWNHRRYFCRSRKMGSLLFLKF